MFLLSVHRPSNRRRAFTLVELMVVVIIIGVLIALLVPAIMGAVRTANNARVSAEINALAQALADFKSKYGDYPPSRIVLVESGEFSIGTGGTLGAAGTGPALLGPRSLAALRKFWPRMQLTSIVGGGTSLASSIPGGFYDFNGNGTQDTSVYMLTGPECLVFFLGGIPQQSGTGAWSVTGFGKNPANPMVAAGLSSGSNNRYAPFYEFNNSRLISNPANTTTTFPGYIDSLGSYDLGEPPFYAYFSAYGGTGYDPDDCNFAEPDNGATPSSTSIAGAVFSNNAVTNPAGVSGNSSIHASLVPNPYYNDVPVPTLASGDIDNTQTRPRAFQNPNSFQIISPGYDRLYGLGGQYIPNSLDSKLPFMNASSGYKANSFQTQQANATVTGVTLSSDIRTREADNLTNFTPGRLD